MNKKQRDQIRNWKKYNESLAKRGSLTLWFDEGAIKAGRDIKTMNDHGSPPIYSDIAILCALSLKVIFH